MTRPASTYHNGSDGHAYTAPTGATDLLELAVTKWDMTVKANNKDVSNPLDGRFRIRGVRDAEGTLSLHWDSANQPSDATASTGPNLRDGSTIALALVEDGVAPTAADLNPTNSFRLTAIIDEVHIVSEFEGTIDYECKYSLQKGSTFKYPGDT